MNVTSALGWILGSQTPNGAIDVIAIRKADGTVNCSPFHVKLPISRSPKSRNIVKLTVNGKEIKLSMKLGSAGEAFFIERTKKTGNPNLVNISDSDPLVPPKSSTIPQQVQLSASSKAIESPSGIRRVQSEGHLKACKNVASLLPNADQSDSPIKSNTEQEEKYDRSSKRRAFTFAGDDYDSLACGNDDGDLNPPVLTEENLIRASSDQPPTINDTLPRSLSRSNEWTWAWGTLPIKASDPSIADLQSLTDLALKEKFSTKSIDPNELPPADGKSAPGFQFQPLSHETDDREYRLVPTDSRGVCIESTNQLWLEDLPLQDNTTTFVEIPEPKYPNYQQPQPSYVHSHTLSDDYRHTSASPGLRDQPRLSHEKQTSLVANHISARAASIASALGSDRILSLCAHILSSDNYPRTEEELYAILKEHAVSPQEFSDNPLDILNNPNLVVVANNLLIPWRLVHAHLTTIPSNQRDPQIQENLTVPANEQSNLWWAGRLVTNWGTLMDGKKLPDNSTVVSIPSASRSGSVRSLSNADGKPESRRDSYTNPDEDDFDHYECMSEGSSVGPTWSQTVSGHPTLDMDTPGAHLWNKETLNWNSADDFQRLLNEYTNADAVPDLLKPYVNYSNIWPTGDLEEGNPVINTSQKDSSTKFSVNSPTLLSSTSHDSGLSMIAAKNNETKIQPTSPEEVSKIDTIGSPPLNPLPDGKTLISKANDDSEALKEDEVVEFLSLEDIPPDEILPGPAREVYDGSDTDSFYSLSLDDETSSHASGSDQKKDKNNPERKYRYRKTLIPTQDQIKLMDLQDGMNEINFEIEGNKVTAHIFVWPDDAKIVVTDIEGALFVSGSSGGALGLMMSLWGSGAPARRETHEGLAQLFDSISSNGYRFLYITTKPDASQKEQLLKSSARGSAKCMGLPAGPVFLPPNALIQTIGSERTDLFKAAALRGVRTLFPPQHNPYHAAFGANARDVRTFDRCDIPPGRTFLVNEKGEVTTMTTVSTKRSFTEMNSLLHQLFPSFSDTFARAKSNLITPSPSIEDTYSDFNYWRIPPPPPPPLPLPMKKK